MVPCLLNRSTVTAVNFPRLVLQTLVHQLLSRSVAYAISDVVPLLRVCVSPDVSMQSRDERSASRRNLCRLSPKLSIMRLFDLFRFFSSSTRFRSSLEAYRLNAR